jgi:hypothetical protein
MVSPPEYVPQSDFDYESMIVLTLIQRLTRSGESGVYDFINHVDLVMPQNFCAVHLNKSETAYDLPICIPVSGCRATTNRLCTQCDGLFSHVSLV